MSDEPALVRQQRGDPQLTARVLIRAGAVALPTDTA